MKTSQIAAKLIVRLFFILLLIALVPFLKGEGDKLQGLYLMPKQAWTLVFPILLILGFIALLIICSIKKYNKPDLNWLLVLNTIVLIVYGATLYVHIFQLIK
jgi:hypothetical protein